MTEQMRQMEVDSYEANIATYKALLLTLDGNWDADLIHLKDLPSHDAAKQCPLDRIERLAALQQYEQISGLLRTEILECSKAKAILNIL
jgi:hypothetical protein